MRRLIVVAALAAAVAGPAHGQAAREARPAMSTPIVFFDIAGPDPAKLAKFYDEVFGWSLTPGPFPGTHNIVDTPVQRPLSGTIRGLGDEGAQFAKLMYFGVPDVTAALGKIAAAGGTIHQPRFEVPGVVVLGLFKDPAGNVMGLVEMAGDRAKVP